jgi:hypothetical protein
MEPGTREEDSGTYDDLPRPAFRQPVLIAAGAVLVLVAGYFAWKYVSEPPPAAPTAPAVVEAPSVAAPEVPSPGVRHPLETPTAEDAAKSPLPPLERSDAVVRETLLDWLGKDAVTSFLQLDDFVRHAVATVDNLGRMHAAPRLWPVSPVPGRYAVVQRGDALVVAPGNEERYAALVSFIDRLDTGQAVALYIRWYPWFQRAYEELGYPGRFFNDRLVEVIDLLLAAPIPSQPVEVKLTEVKGPIPSTRPWLRYEFVDPSLEALTAGQKMMIRVGPNHQQRLRLKLADLRARITKTAKPR